MSTSTTMVKRAARSDLTSAAIFYTVVLFLTGVIVYFIGYQQDNPDATILVVLIPTTVAVLITARTLGRAGVRRLLRLRGDSPWSARLLLTTALAIPTIALAAIFIGSTVTGQSSEFAMPADGLLILLVLVVIVIGEEYGFRGYMLPRLQSRYSALVAGIITGAAWWLWHYPPSLIGTGTPLDTPFWLFGIWVVAVTVLMTSVFNASRGSVGMMMLFHLTANASFVFLPLLPENREGDLTTFSVFVALVVVVAAVVVRINGPSSLSTTPRTTQRQSQGKESQSSRPFPRSTTKITAQGAGRMSSRQHVNGE